ncbi:ABC-type glycerol-3-phosphate transport system, substrate-binding protein [Ruminococcus sp. YE71]|uniref:ABC transporter substrate-binding protein n=1 Tax=unclassified Ruminococcus TaxID=2608920 RepID=UPI0008853754|nr:MULTISPECIES: ABC transporter substrate-binding protein [unclassified Ruminococcus]SDA18665.1 ABC-type glycerol-3-phosphate transport system, substrate-binding protein [Ruminococcus sp. YE78]SFW29516.1 ABC-type glycerol-3-phosphate transport system, substrate-binding protein [Ruminococcus sp. YE71]
MRIKRILAGAFALTMAFAVASCGKSGGSSSESKPQGGKELDEEDKATISELKDQLEDKELANKEIKWMAHYDINPSEGAVKSPGLELFEQKYDGKVKWVQTTWNTRYDDLANAVMGGNSPDFFPASDMDTFPKGAIKGMFDPIDDVIDLGSDLWASTKESSDNFVFNGKHYVAVIDVSPNYVCVYNKTTIEQNGFDDPAQLLEDGKWDWDTFKTMCTEFTDADNDKYALDGYWYVKAISETCGKPLIGLDNGMLVNNMSDPDVEKVQNFMYELGKNGVMFDRSTNGWQTRGDGTTGNGLGDYQTLFIPVGLWGIEAPLATTKPFGDMEAGEIMFVPMPKDPDSDTYYISSRVDGYNLCHNAPNPEGFAAYMSCLMVAKDNAASIYEKTLKEEYKWTDEMYEMRQRIYQMAAEHPVFSFADGVSAEMDAAMLNVSQATMLTGGGATTWTECVGEYGKQVDFIVKEANTKISDTPTN